MVNIFRFFKGVGETSCYVLTVKDMTFVSDNDERCDYVVLVCCELCEFKFSSSSLMFLIFAGD